MHREEHGKLPQNFLLVWSLRYIFISLWIIPLTKIWTLTGKLCYCKHGYWFWALYDAIFILERIKRISMDSILTVLFICEVVLGWIPLLCFSKPETVLTVAMMLDLERALIVAKLVCHCWVQPAPSSAVNLQITFVWGYQQGLCSCFSLDWSSLHTVLGKHGPGLEQETWNKMNNQIKIKAFSSLPLLSKQIMTLEKKVMEPSHFLITKTTQCVSLVVRFHPDPCQRLQSQNNYSKCFERLILKESFHDFIFLH